MKKIMLLLALLPMLSSCTSNDEDTLKSYYAVSCGSTIDVDANASFVIDNEFIASYKNGQIKGEHIGTTTAYYNGNKQTTIEVTGTIDYIPYPITDWSATYNDVKKAQSVGTSTDDEGETLLYTVKSGSKIKYLYYYSFKNGILSGSAIVIPSYEGEVLVNWLWEKYLLFPTGDDNIFSGGYDAYETSRASTSVGITTLTQNSSTYISSYAYMIVFLPTNKTRASDDYEYIREKVSKLGIVGTEELKDNTLLN